PSSAQARPGFHGPYQRRTTLSPRRASGKGRAHQLLGDVVPPCREEMPTLERLYEQSRREGLVVLAVSVDGDSQSVAPFVHEQRLTFAIGLDPNMTVSTTYGVRGLPASFIIDRDGYLAAVALGPRTWDNAASKALVEGLSR